MPPQTLWHACWRAAKASARYINVGEKALSDSVQTTEEGATDWGRCLRAFFATVVGGASMLSMFLILVDPYDSGKFGFLGIEGVADRNSTTASASRARDASINSAIIGNSTALLIDPNRLSLVTGLRFVQLSVVGRSPREEFTVLDFFLRHHRHVGALVIVTDPGWCVHDQRAPGPFPYWIYGESSFTYAVHLMSSDAVEHAFRRLSIGLGWSKRSDPTGAFPADDVWPAGLFYSKNKPMDPPPATDVADKDVFPHVMQLNDVVTKLPMDVPVVILVPPTFATTVPQPDSFAATEKKACDAALRKIVAGRPRSNFINYRVDNSLTRDRSNWLDFIHYRPVIAERIGDGIVESLHLGEAAKIDFERDR
jgi:hypothetical protein